MSKHLVVFGHGQGDPGAMGNGYQEATFTRNILGQKLKAWASKLKRNQIDFYNESLDMFQQTKAGGGAYDVNGYDSVTELHLDGSENPNAENGHVIINARFKADSNDLAIAKVIEKYVGLWGSSKPTGVVGRSDLLNCNVFANRGISYRLVELGFITNKRDIDELTKNLDAIAKGIVEAITGESLSGATSSTNTVSKPQTPSDHDKAVAESKAVHQGNAWAKLEKFNEVSKGKVRITGWLVPDKPEGPIGKYAYILIIEHATTKEITRVASQGIKRPDVKKNYGYKGGDALGMDVTVDLSWVKKDTKIDVIFRRCNQANGEGAVNDVRIKDIYLAL
ncbi:N-acetylmuramoyl-L-alanine amidase [Enterococcus durans]|uniref:N-acetylmuramoyl-L-alanine amidase n=1 Tax=Enterococcus durans TaxID=53345 RepID=UPI0011BD8C85|nr:N-acetylmuramoyl-L-alanine amidase [Enterococcus durans]QED60686.1 N-acetylmuramoyl-L-alanine amidase [Enterococcus durans]QED63289.1 N-acetylmuramoyl-L-alanine amidase [Enterococcus durans]